MTHRECLTVLKIHGQGRTVFFLDVLEEDWPRAVDARPERSTEGEEEETAGSEVPSDSIGPERSVREASPPIAKRTQGNKNSAEGPSAKKRRVEPSPGQRGDQHGEGSETDGRRSRTSAVPDLDLCRTDSAI